MPGFFKSVADHNDRYARWTNLISNLGTELPIPESFATNMSEEELDGPYNRLNGYLKQWMLGMLEGDESKRGDMHESEFADFNIDRKILPDDWYELAIAAAKKKNVSGLPSIGSPDSKISHNLYTKLMPAYRALKESFDKRPFWQWFTKHAEYTAERDAMKAIKGFVKATTSLEPKAFDRMYTTYRDQLDNTDFQTSDKENPLYEPVAAPTDIYERIEGKLYDQRFIDELANDIINELSVTDENDKAKKLEAIGLSMKALRATVLQNLDKFDRAGKNQALNNITSMTIAVWGVTDIIVKNYMPSDTESRTTRSLVERQLITDAIMRKLSPAAFLPGYEKYTDGYILKNSQWFPVAFTGYRSNIIPEALAPYLDAKGALNKNAVGNVDGNDGAENALSEQELAEKQRLQEIERNKRIQQEREQNERDNIELEKKAKERAETERRNDINEQKAVEEKGVSTLSQLSNPRSWAEFKNLDTKDNQKVLADVFAAYLAKPIASAASRSSGALAVIKVARDQTNQIWRQGIDLKNPQPSMVHQMKQYSTELFKHVYISLNLNPSLAAMNVADRLVAAQKMTNLMIKVFSPAASSDPLKECCQSYALKSMDSEDIAQFTHCTTEEVDTFMENVYTELGMKQQVKFNPDTFSEKPSDKISKIQEIAPPSTEKLI